MDEIVRVITKLYLYNYLYFWGLHFAGARNNVLELAEVIPHPRTLASPSPPRQ